ncbi:hypothetical protein AALP_AA8G291700 [Arabis alpina]|uniref:Uncharacterized protein n=1 Tax=Arabis alpina TaxID=50452 RepID=A0A087GA70_ARAAL|nr:hypothetical protein AALP_AA8G291700 [Arabis alpina]
MIDSVFELVNKTTSNSLFMFLFCNFIIILIIVGNSKPAFHDNSSPGSQEPIFISDPVLSSKSVLISDSVLAPKPGIEKPVWVLSPKPGLDKPVSVLSPKSGLEKPVSVLSSKSGLQKPVLISKPILTSKPGFEKSVLNSEPSLTSNTGLQAPGMISKSTLSTKPAGSEQFRTSKPGSNFLEKEEKGIRKKESLLEVENESEVECVLRRRVEEFIRKVNTQWKSENVNTDYLLY